MLQSWARWENYSFTINIKWNLKTADSIGANAPPGGQTGGGGITLPDLPIPDVPTVYERQSYIMSPFGYLKVLSWVFLTMGWSFLVEEVHVIKGGNTKIEFVWITMLISWIVYRLVQGRFNDFWFYGPPNPAGQGLCGFNRGWSYVVKSRVKSFATPSMTELYRWEVGREN